MESKQMHDYEALRQLVLPHIESFDYFLDEGLEKAFLSIRPIEIVNPATQAKLRVSLEKPQLFPPMVEGRVNKLIFPNQCREARTTYKGEFRALVYFQYDDQVIVRESTRFGHLPIMLKSKLCHLRGADPQKLVFLKEEATEMGGCVREDQSYVTLKLYYLENGSVRLGFWIGGREFLLPIGIILKALINTNDNEIFVSLTSCYNERYQREKGAVGTQLIGEKAQIILDEVRDLSLLTRLQCLKHIGEYFQPAMEGFENESRTTVAEAVLRDYIFVHLTSNHDKFNLLIFILQKLYALVDQTAAPDNPDALQNQEILLPGHLITIYSVARFGYFIQNSALTCVFLASECCK